VFPSLRVSLWTTRLSIRYCRIASAFCSIVFRIWSVASALTQ